MRIPSIVLIGLISFAAAELRAGELIAADLQITPDREVIGRGDVGQLEFRVRNTGKAPLEIATAGFTFRTFGPQSTLFPFRLGDTEPCFFAVEGPSPRPGEPGINGLTLSFLPRPVAVGEERVCTIGFQVSPDAAGPFVQRFSFTGVSGSQTQNVALHFVFPLGDPPPLVPTLSLHWLWLLGGLFAGIAALAIRR